MKPKEIAQKIRPVLEKYQITKAELFGSFARGEETAESDVDLIVQLGKPTGLFEFVRIERELGHALGRRVDMTTRNGLSKYIRDNVLAEAQVVYER